jgi:hypothetical protein
MNQLRNDNQAAALLTMSVKSLQTWKRRGGGPPFKTFGRLMAMTMPIVCCAPLKLWTASVVSWMQKTHRIYSRPIAVEDN